MKLKLPSPAMVVALIALAVAMSGSAVAAVTFARNAGAVDGKSAVADGAALKSRRRQARRHPAQGRREGHDLAALPRRERACPRLDVDLRQGDPADRQPGARARRHRRRPRRRQPDRHLPGRERDRRPARPGHDDHVRQHLGRCGQLRPDRELRGDGDHRAAEHGDAVVQDLRLAAVHDAHRARGHELRRQRRGPAGRAQRPDRAVRGLRRRADDPAVVS